MKSIKLSSPRENSLTPVQAIRAHCLDCCCGSPKEVRFCPNIQCTLYPFRLGKNPNRNRGMGKHTLKELNTEKPLANSPIPTTEGKGEK